MIDTLISTGLFATIITIVVSVLLALYIGNRAGSLGFALDRLWRLAGGRTEFDNTALRKIDSEHAQLEYFNYKYKLGADHIDDIGCISDFMLEHRVSMEKLCRMRTWFSLEPQPNLKTPSAAKRGWVIAFGITLYLPMASALWAFSFDQTYLWISKTGERFRTDGKVAIGKVFGPEEIVLSACDTFIPKAPNDIARERLTTLCKSAKKPEFQDMVKNSIASQRILLAIIFLAVVGVLFVCFRYVIGSTEAEKFAARIASSAHPPAPDTSERRLG